MRPTDRYLSIPQLDLVISAFTGLLCGFLLPRAMDDEARFGLYGALAAVAAVLLAIASVVQRRFTNTKSSTLTQIYKRSAPLLRKNWRVVMGSCGAASSIALILFIIDGYAPRISLGLSVAAVASICLSFIRTFVLHGLADRGDDISDAERPTVRVNPRVPDYSK